jgi:hypothetical protein
MREKVIEFMHHTQFYNMVSETIAALFENSGDISEDARAKLLSILDIEELEADIIPVYERMFTESELDSILSFFNSTAGQKMLQVNTSVSDEVNSIFSEWLSSKYNMIG